MAVGPQLTATMGEEEAKKKQMICARIFCSFRIEFQFGTMTEVGRLFQKLLGL